MTAAAACDTSILLYPYGQTTLNVGAAAQYVFENLLDRDLGPLGLSLSFQQGLLGSGSQGLLTFTIVLIQNDGTPIVRTVSVPRANFQQSVNWVVPGLRAIYALVVSDTAADAGVPVTINVTSIVGSIAPASSQEYCQEKNNNYH